MSRPSPSPLSLPVLVLVSLSCCLLLAPPTLIRGAKADITFSSPGLQPWEEEALAYFERMAPDDRERPLDVAPLGNFRPAIPDLAHRKGLIYTQQGFFNPKDPRAFDGLPADLRPVAVHPAPKGKGPGLGAGTGIMK